MKRRAILTGLVAMAAAGGVAWRLHLFGPHYAPTPYDDLLGQIDDRRPAIVFGRAVLKTMPGANAASIARQLRGSGNLAADAARESADGRISEVAGWLVPDSVARYAALAAAV
jgi:hypothetical protein